MAKNDKAVAVRDERSTALSTEIDPSILLQDAAERERFSKDDLAIPFLRVLQALSPQCSLGNPKYDPNARPGMFINTATGDMYSGETGILLIPVIHSPSYIEWRIRERQGGLVQDHGAVRPNLRTTRDEKKRERIVGPNGEMTDNQLVRSSSYFALLFDEQSQSENPYRSVVFNLSGTQLKKAREWNTKMEALRAPHPSDPSKTFNPAYFYMAYRITTLPEKNDQGSWMGVKIVPEIETLKLPFGAQAYLRAREMKEQVLSGAIKAAKPDEEIAEATIEDDDKF